MASIDSSTNVASSAVVSPQQVQSQKFSPPLFKGENLTQPTRDGFVSTQPKESFYQRHKLLVWGAGIAAAAGLAFFGHRTYKLNKGIKEGVKKITESVDNLDMKRFSTDCDGLIKEHNLQNNKRFTLVDLKSPKVKDYLQNFDEHFLGHCDDANYAIAISYKDKDKTCYKFLKVYKAQEVDEALKAQLEKKGGKLTIKKK